VTQHRLLFFFERYQSVLDPFADLVRRQPPPPPPPPQPHPPPPLWPSNFKGPAKPSFIRHLPFGGRSDPSPPGRPFSSSPNSGFHVFSPPSMRKSFHPLPLPEIYTAPYNCSSETSPNRSAVVYLLFTPPRKQTHPLVPPISFAELAPLLDIASSLVMLTPPRTCNFFALTRVQIEKSLYYFSSYIVCPIRWWPRLSFFFFPTQFSISLLPSHFSS